MKKKLLFAIAILCFNLVNAQEPQNNYLFKDFTNALIIYKDGTKFGEALNYDLKDGQFVFIDKKDKLKKKFARPDLIGLIRVGDRCFLLNDNHAQEVIQTDPKFYVTYTGKLITAAENTSFGGSSKIASVETYSSLPGNGLSSAIRDNKFEVVGINKSYDAELKGKEIRFNDKRTFLKAIPKSKRANAEKYIDANNTDFENTDQVLSLFNKVANF